MNWLDLKNMMKTDCTGDKMLEAIGYIWMVAAVVVIVGSLNASARGK